MAEITTLQERGMYQGGEARRLNQTLVGASDARQQGCPQSGASQHRLEAFLVGPYLRQVEHSPCKA
jgi:hypothetical protein